MPAAVLEAEPVAFEEPVGAEELVRIRLCRHGPVREDKETVGIGGVTQLPGAGRSPVEQVSVPEFRGSLYGSHVLG